MKSKAELLALEFSRVLRSWLTPQEMRQVIKKDREYIKAGEPYSAAGDFCDANMAMLEAWNKVVGVDLFKGANAMGELKEEHVALWNEAWALAKRNGYSLK